MSVVSCSAGYYCPSGTSTVSHICPGGYFCPSNSKYPTPCPPGTYCPEQSSSPVNCPTGYYCPGLSLDKTPCTAGNYCPSGTISQIPCTGNTYSSAGSSTCSCMSPPNGTATGTISSCIVTCNPGYTHYKGQCYSTMKPAKLTYLTSNGTYSVSTTPYTVYTCPPCYSQTSLSLCVFSETCSPTCSNGYILDQNSKCTPCPPGQQSVNNRCVSVSGCPAGSWSAPGSTQCTLCPAGKYSTTVGATSATTCLPCPSGTWSSVLGASRCIPCSPGTWSKSIGRTTTCTDTCPTRCAAGQYMSKTCEPSSGSYTCTACSNPPSGKYVTSICLWNRDTQFASFPSCSTGFYLTESNAGTYSKLGSAGMCTPCFRPMADTLDYVTGVCTATRNTIVATRASCPSSSYYVSDFSQGDYNVLGTEGDCELCSSPAANTKQYVTELCTSTRNTVITSRVSCSPGQTLTGFTQGNRSTLGTAGTCV